MRIFWIVVFCKTQPWRCWESFYYFLCIFVAAQGQRLPEGTSRAGLWLSDPRPDAMSFLSCIFMLVKGLARIQTTRELWPLFVTTKNKFSLQMLCFRFGFKIVVQSTANKRSSSKKLCLGHLPHPPYQVKVIFWSKRPSEDMQSYYCRLPIELNA